MESSQCTKQSQMTNNNIPYTNPCYIEGTSFPSMLPAYKFHSCSYRLYSLLVFLISKCHQQQVLASYWYLANCLSQLHERLLLMSFSFYHTLANFFLSSLLSIQAFLHVQLFLSSGLNIISIRKTPLSTVSKALTTHKKLVVASQRQLKAGQVSVQLIASLWQVYMQLASQLGTLNVHINCS